MIALKPNAGTVLSSINFATKEISVKIVFYGPGLGGKTTTLQAIWNSIKPDRRPQMVSLATDIDRTIFFDFLPVNAYKIGDFVVRLQLYTVPGQVFYNSTRKLVLSGVDGVVFVADSQPQALDENKESLQNLADNLNELGMSLGRVPYVMQYNKRDLDGVSSIEELQAQFNTESVPHYATVALNGEGVGEVLRGISRLVISDLNNKGVGKKLMQPQESTGAKSAAAAANFGASMSGASMSSPSMGGASSMEAALAQATSHAPVSFAPMWPTAPQQKACQTIEENIATGEFSRAVLAAWSLGLDATGTAQNAEPGLEMLLRGVTPPKYLRFRELVQRAKAGEALQQNDALFALHTVIELVA